MSDLHEKIEWLKANNDKAKQIAENGKNLYTLLYNIDNLSRLAG